MPRLFIALPIEKQVVESLAELAASETSGWRWVRMESLHITLAFLGTVEEGLVDAAERAMLSSATRADPLDLTAEGIGAFPDERRARVVWAGVGGDLAALARLHADLTSELRSEGFELEVRRFNPHITLARSRDPRPLPAGLDRSWTFGAWRAANVHLFESHLGPAGPRYEVRATAGLGEVDG